MQIENLFNPFFVGMKIKHEDKPSEIVNEDSVAITNWIDDLLSHSELLRDTNEEILKFIFQETTKDTINNKIFEMAEGNNYIFINFDNKLYKIQIAQYYSMPPFPEYTIALNQSMINEINLQLSKFIDLIGKDSLFRRKAGIFIDFVVWIPLFEQIPIIRYISSFSRGSVLVSHNVYKYNKGQIIKNGDIYAEYGLLGVNSNFIIEQYNKFIDEVLYYKKPSFSETKTKIHPETQHIIDNLEKLTSDLKQASEKQPENEELKKVYERYVKC